MSQKIKELLKRSLAVAAYYSGIAWLSLALGFRQRVVVLMYHRVLPAQPPADVFSSDAIVVTPRTFERHMRFLRRFCNPLRVEQLAAMIRGEAPWPARACVVTFDDGWFDNAQHALPVLERNAVPAVVFVATGLLGTATTFWQERLTRLLFRAWQLREPARPIFAALGAVGILQTAEPDARKRVRDLVTAMKPWTQDQIRDLAARIEQLLGDHGIRVDCGDDRFMSWAQAASLLNSGLVAVESHAHSHAPLTSIDHQAVSHELSRSKHELQTQLGRDCRFLAYPNGNYDEHVAALARAAGYELAFTTDSGCVLPGDDRYKLKRINIGERGTDSNHGFLCRLLGWW